MRLLGNKKLWERTPTHEPFYPEPGTIQSARTVRFNHHIIMHNGKGFYQLPKGQITFVPFLFRRKLFASVIYALLVQKKISSQKKLNCQKKVCVFRDSKIHTRFWVLGVVHTKNTRKISIFMNCGVLVLKKKRKVKTTIHTHTCDTISSDVVHQTESYHFSF